MDESARGDPTVPRAQGQHARDGARETLPVARLLGELFSPVACELIELGLAVVLRVAPFRFDQPLLLQPVERGIQ